MIRLKSLAWLGIAAALTFVSLQASAAEWRRQTISQDGFSVEFSGPMATAPVKLAAETQAAVVRSTMYSQSSSDYAFTVGATLLRGSFNFPAGVSGTVGTFKCARTDADTSATLPDGTLTRTVHASQCDGDVQIICRFFQRGQWFYQLIATTRSGTDQADSEHFVTSFRLLPL